METTSDSVLVLGDGNFSFSLALYSTLSQRKPLNLIATSFDSSEEVRSKYPESGPVLLALARYGETRFSIDATKDLMRQLNVDRPVGHIIFNFPHLGVENNTLHSQLVGHIFHRYYE